MRAIHRDPTDISNGTVLLTLTTNDPAGNCVAVSDTMRVYIDYAPVANAGTDVITCEGSGGVTIGDAVVVNASFPPSVWTKINGTGILSDAGTLTPTYTPGVGEIGIVTLQLTAQDAGSTCPGVNDQVNIQIIREAGVFAGADKSVCGGVDVFMIDAATSGSTTSVKWSGGSGTFLPNDSTLNAVYRPAVIGNGHNDRAISYHQ